MSQYYNNQKIKTPPVSDCWRGCKAELEEDWDFRFTFRVPCKQHHAFTGFFIEKNRAVHKWNNLMGQPSSKCNKWKAPLDESPS